MNHTPKYEIWTADLNSLYLDECRPPVFAEDCFTYDEAVKARSEWQQHDTAAWIRDKETGEVVR